MFMVLWALITKALTGLLAIGYLLLFWYHHSVIRDMRVTISELAKDVDDNSASVAGFGKFIRVVEEAQKRNGGVA